MSTVNQTSNNRIVKNTLVLYLRTFFTMIISLYTSRVILQALGQEDFGIYSVIGGVVSMFSVISGALISSISRYITFELGKGDSERLNKIMCISINIQLILSAILLIIGETLGIWFLNYKMNIPADRLFSANWVLQLSLFSFIVNLLSVPYNALIIAKERMSVFAYVSILEVVLKLLIVLCLFYSPYDKLIFYSFFVLVVSIIIRFVYGIYCHRKFEESKYHYCNDRLLLKEMFSFAGWNFFGNTVFIFNTQGIAILINLFFDVTVNAARGITSQVENAVLKFVNDFTTAINPQITKSYAVGDFHFMYSLVCRGAKFSFFLTFFFSIPLIFETEWILNFWLGDCIPDHTVNFVRLMLVCTLLDRLGSTGYTACMATGNVKRYVFCVSGMGCLVFPLTYLAYRLGAPVEASYFVYFFVTILVTFVRLLIMKYLIKFPIRMFFENVILPVVLVSLFSVLPILYVYYNLEYSLFRLLVLVAVDILSLSFFVWNLGLSASERLFIKDKIIHVIR